MYKLYMCFKYIAWRWRLSLLSILPVALGVFLIIFAGGIMTGFADEMEEKTRGVFADIICEPTLAGIPHYDDFCRRVTAHPLVRLATPIVYSYGLVKNPSIHNTRGCSIIGIRPEEKAVMGRFKEALVIQSDAERPSFKVPLGAPYPGMIVGSQIIGSSLWPIRYQNAPGTTLVLSTIPMRPSGALDFSLGGVPKVNTAAFTIVDVFNSRFYLADSTFIYIDFAEAQKLAGMVDPLRANQFEVRLEDGADYSEAVQAIKGIWREFQAAHPEDLAGHIMNVIPWQEKQAAYLSAVKMQRNVTILMLSAILLAAGALILVTTWVICHIKTRDIGILKALGASDIGVATIFTAYGLVVGLIGASVGMGVAFAGLANLDTLHEWVSKSVGFEVFPSEVYYFDTIPHTEPAWLVWGTFAFTVLLGALSSAVASLGTARKPPVEALRYE